MIKQELQEAITAIHSLQDPPLFTQRYLQDKKYLRWYHKVDEVLQESSFSLFLVHPGSGKSTRISFIEVLMEICENRRARIGYFSKTQDKAKLFMEATGTELRTNRALIQDYGAFYDPRLGWSASKIRVLGSDLTHPTPTLINVGASSQIEALRFNLLILDDPIDLHTALSPAETSRMNKLLGSLIDRIDPGGRLIIVGHRFLPNDNYQQIIDDRPYIRSTVLEAIDEEGNCLDPELWSCRRHKPRIEELQDIEDVWKIIESCPACKGGERLIVEKRERHSKWEWLAWYQQQRVSPEDATFGGIPKAYIKGEPPDLKKFATADPAYSTDNNADYSVVLVGAPYLEGILLTDIQDWRINKGWAPSFCDFAAEAGARKMRVEDNNARTLPQDCRDYVREEGTPLLVENLHSSRDKSFRIGELAGRAEQGRIYFLHRLKKLPAFKRLLKEWDLYPNAGHDDHLDCLDMLWRLLKEKRPRPGIRGARI